MIADDYDEQPQVFLGKPYQLHRAARRDSPRPGQTEAMTAPRAGRVKWARYLASIASLSWPPDSLGNAAPMLPTTRRMFSPAEMLSKRVRVARQGAEHRIECG